jgi:hypothetical protein
MKCTIKKSLKYLLVIVVLADILSLILSFLLYGPEDARLQLFVFFVFVKTVLFLLIIFFLMKHK